MTARTALTHLSESTMHRRRLLILAGAAAAVGGTAWAMPPTGAVAQSNHLPLVPARPQPVQPPQPAAPPEPVLTDQPALPEVPAPPTRWAPPLVQRRAWCERQPAANHRLMDRVNRITIHHTGVDTRSLGASDLQTVQRIERYHRDQRGWACIGYHYLVAADGTLYEGRPLGLQGAHVKSSNLSNIGIALIGDCHAAEPTTGQMASLRWLLSHTCRQHAIDPHAVYGHRELAPTTCPGDALFAWLVQWRSAILAGNDAVAKV